MLISFDPGPHTGMALFSHDGHFLSAATYDVEAMGLLEQYRSVQRMITSLIVGDFTVVCESFRTVAPRVSGTTEAIATIRMCGFIEGTTLLARHPFVWQAPPARKAFVKAATQLPHVTVHEIAAIAHGLAYLAKNGPPHVRTGFEHGVLS